jgi:hypothetical protein
MTVPPGLRIAASLMLSMVALDAGAQQLQEPTFTFREARPETVSPKPAVPSTLRLYLTSMIGATTAGMGGFVVGGMMDHAECKRENAGRTGVIFTDPCALSFDQWAAVGWAGGSALGATVTAASNAHKRGCPWKQAGLRALGGSLIGVAPGLLVIARHPEKYPAPRTALVLSAPLLAGVGSAAAVVSCRRP